MPQKRINLSFFRKSKHEFIEHAICLSTEETESSTELKLLFWLPYKILNHYNYTNYQKAAEAKDDSDN
jgi:hypothetical protein